MPTATSEPSTFASTIAAPANDSAAMTAAARSDARSTKLTPSADPERDGFTTQGGRHGP